MENDLLGRRFYCYRHLFAFIIDYHLDPNDQEKSTPWRAQRQKSGLRQPGRRPMTGRAQTYSIFARLPPPSGSPRLGEEPIRADSARNRLHRLSLRAAQAVTGAEDWNGLTLVSRPLESRGTPPPGSPGSRFDYLGCSCCGRRHARCSVDCSTNRHAPRDVSAGPRNADPRIKRCTGNYFPRPGKTQKIDRLTAVLAAGGHRPPAPPLAFSTHSRRL